VAYEYHGLFRDFLLARGRQALSGTDLAAARTHAASLVEEDGDVESAADLYRDAGNWAELARLVVQRAPELLAHGRHQTLEHWLRALPESAREADPWLASWLGMSRFLFDLPGSRAILQSAYTEFNRRGDAAGAFLAWSRPA